MRPVARMLGGVARESCAGGQAFLDPAAACDRGMSDNAKHWLGQGGVFDCEAEQFLGEVSVGERDYVCECPRHLLTSSLAHAQGKTLRNKTFFSNGNRGVIYTADFWHTQHGRTAGPVKVAVKELLHERLLKPGRMACPGALKSEASWLCMMNEYGIGPRLLHADADRVVMDFVPGKRILSFIADSADAGLCTHVLIKVLRELRRLDALGIHKGELTKPDRHILVKADGSPVLIDFERCKHSSSPQNVLQVCQFLASKPLATALAARGKNLVLDCSSIREHCRAYKHNNYQEQDFEQILAILEDSRIAPVQPSSSSISHSFGWCADVAAGKGSRKQDVVEEDEDMDALLRKMGLAATHVKQERGQAAEETPVEFLDWDEMGKKPEEATPPPRVACLHEAERHFDPREKRHREMDRAQWGIQSCATHGSHDGSNEGASLDDESNDSSDEGQATDCGYEPSSFADGGARGLPGAPEVLRGQIGQIEISGLSF